MELLQKISAVAVSITAILTFLSAICKPFRSLIMKFLPQTETYKKLDAIEKSLEKVDAKVDAYEKDRIRREIFYWGNRCREGNRLSLETYRSLQLDFERYSVELKGNGIVAQEWEFITHYFNEKN